MFSQRSVVAATALLLLQLSVSRLTTAQLPFPRQCPEVKVPTEFNTDAYMGVWYEYSKYPFVFEIGKKCMQALYSNAGNNTVDVVNSSINRFTGTNSSTIGIAKVLAPCKLAVMFNRSLYPRTDNYSSPNYVVLGTDYQTYSVVYSCTNLSAYAHTKLLWILTRERKPTPETIQKASDILDANQLSQSFLIDTIQDGCPGDEPVVSTTSTVGPHIPLDNGSFGTTDQPETPAEVIDLDTLSTETSNMIDKA